VQAQLRYQLIALLNPRGFVLESQGKGGLVFRRERHPLFIAGLVALILGALMTIGGAWYVGVPLAILGVGPLWIRQPATVSVRIEPSPDGFRIIRMGHAEKGIRELVTALGR
jgi:hypothetical protein